MLSDMKQSYYQKNVDLDEYYFSDSKQDIDETIDMSTGWSLICLDETINYYADNFLRKRLDI